MFTFLTVMVVALLSFIVGYTLGLFGSKEEPIGDLVLANDGEGGSYIFLQLEQDKTPANLQAGNKIFLRIREVSTDSNETKKLSK